MHIWSTFVGRMSVGRGERALQKGETRKALVALRTAFNRFTSYPRRLNRRNFKLVERSLAALIDACQETGLIDEAVGYCRVGREVGLQAAVAFEFPCQRWLASPSSLSAESVEDLVLWACWPGALEGAVSPEAVESLLQSKLLPTAAQDVSSTEHLLNKLCCSSFAWSWVPLYLAEIARLRGDWSTAAGRLGEAAKLAPESGAASRWRWQQIHCLVCAGRFVDAHREYLELSKTSPPQAPEHWRIVVQLQKNSPERALATAVSGLREHPLDEHLLREVLHQCSATSLWAPMRFALEKVTPAAKDTGQLAVIVPAMCITAMELKDVALAQECAERIFDLTAPGETDERFGSFAAVVFACDNRWPNGPLPRLAETVYNAKIRRILYVLGFWARCANQNWDWARSLGAKVRTETPPPLPGPEWQQLIWIINCRTLLLQEKGEQLLSKLLKAVETEGDVVGSDGLDRNVAHNGDRESFSAHVVSIRKCVIRKRLPTPFA